MSVAAGLQAHLRPGAGVRTLAVAYVLAIAAGEALVATGAIAAGAVVHAALVVVVVNQAMVGTRAGWPGEPAARALGALAIVPVLSLVSLAVVVPDVEPVYRYAIAGAPLVVAAAAAERLLGCGYLIARLRAASWPRDAAIGSAGIPIGFVSYLAFRPEPLLQPASWLAFAGAVLIVAAFVGVLEEVIFRGIVQEALSTFFGARAYLWSSLLFAAVYLAVRPVAYAALVAAIGLAFGWIVMQTGSLVGVAAAHAAFAVGALVVWPALLG